MVIVMTSKIHDERMKRYFIDSAKSIIMSEGTKALSVRNVAERAGYSYATLYNYFSDLNQLLNICTGEFIAEAVEFVNGRIVGSTDIKSTACAYCDYFVQYTGIYSLIFCERKSYGTSEKAHGLLHELIAAKWTETFGNSDESQVYANIFTDFVDGALLMYISRGIPESYPDFRKSLQVKITNLLDLVKCKVEN
jgi:AcrR family transcriptional regulator